MLRQVTFVDSDICRIDSRWPQVTGRTANKSIDEFSYVARIYIKCIYCGVLLSVVCQCLIYYLQVQVIFVFLPHTPAFISPLLSTSCSPFCRSRCHSFFAVLSVLSPRPISAVQKIIAFVYCNVIIVHPLLAVRRKQKMLESKGNINRKKMEHQIRDNGGALHSFRFDLETTFQKEKNYIARGFGGLLRWKRDLTTAAVAGVLGSLLKVRRQVDRSPTQFNKYRSTAAQMPLTLSPLNHFLPPFFCSQQPP